MLTNGDVKLIRKVIKEEITIAIAPLVTKDEIKSLVTKKELKSELKQTELRLKKAIKREHKYQGEALNYCEKEDQKILTRVENIEHHFNFAPAI